MAKTTSRGDLAPPVDAESLYMQLGHVLASFPTDFSRPLSSETMAWLSKAHALLLAADRDADAIGSGE